MPIRPLIIIVLAALLLGGCGRKGSLEEPGAADAATLPAVADDVVPANAEAEANEAGGVESPPPAPARRFPLDFLL
jgi:predicted small lipoprotein YifL